MPLMLDDFEALKRKVEDLTRKRDQKVGAKAEILSQLKRKFGCGSLDEAKELLAKELATELRIAGKVALRTKRFEDELAKVPREVFDGPE